MVVSATPWAQAEVGADLILLFQLRCDTTTQPSSIEEEGGDENFGDEGRSG